MTDVLLVGDSERSPDLRHAVPVAIGDPFVYAEVDGRRVAVVWSIEGDRIAAVDPGIEIVPVERFRLTRILGRDEDPYAVWPEECVRVVRALGLRAAHVPSGFPLLVADALRADGVELTPDPALFAERRRVKTPHQLAGIRRAQRAAEAGMTAVRDLLRRSEPGPDGRTVDGEPLTAELLRRAATEAFALHGARGDDLVAAPGAQAANGHDQGSGRIANDDVVVCDFFPRDTESACYADMTRTFRVGAEDAELTAWHGLCREALELAVGLIRPGAHGGELHRAVSEHFERHGQRTQLSRAEGEVLREGFHHGLGHGVGLQVHEAPGLGRVGHALVAGDVVAVEPGLYRPGFGGVRLEDLVLVTEDGGEVLTDFPYDLAVA